jgi:RNA polymerase sigma-70 factor (ECF subfamily)
MLATAPEADTILVAAAQAGSQDAFGALVDRYRSPVVRLAYRLTHDADEANDIAQDAFLRAYKRINEFESGRPFSRWIFVIARNAALDSLRRRKRSATLVAETPPELDDVVSPEDLVLQNDEASRVHAALASLPPRYRDALELYYLRDMRYRDIAVALDVPIGTVKTFISRAKRRLRDDLIEAAPIAVAA